MTHTMIVKRALKRIRAELCLRLRCPTKPRGFFDAPELKPDDVFLVSFPRSGNTWVRNIIAHCLYSHDRINSLADLNNLVPDIHRGIPNHDEYSNPRVIKTHRSFAYRHERSNKALYSKNIYLVRHPFNVIRSYYHFQLKLWKRPEQTLERFVDKFTCGAIRTSWQEHVLSWKVMENELEILFIRYEDLERAPVREICKIANFLGVELTPTEGECINLKCSREAMVEMEKKGSFVDEEYLFIRREKDSRAIGDSDLTPEMKDLIWERSKVAMNLFNYGIDEVCGR